MVLVCCVDIALNHLLAAFGSIIRHRRAYRAPRVDGSAAAIMYPICLRFYTLIKRVCLALDARAVISRRFLT